MSAGFIPTGTKSQVYQIRITLELPCKYVAMHVTPAAPSEISALISRQSRHPAPLVIASRACSASGGRRPYYSAREAVAPRRRTLGIVAPRRREGGPLGGRAELELTPPSPPLSRRVLRSARLAPSDRGLAFGSAVRCVAHSRPLRRLSRAQRAPCALGRCLLCCC